jgi:hypothetical protein
MFPSDFPGIGHILIYIYGAASVFGFQELFPNLLTISLFVLILR